MTQRLSGRLVVEALGREDLPQVLDALVAVRQAALLALNGVGRRASVGAAEARSDLRAAHLLQAMNFYRSIRVYI